VVLFTLPMLAAAWLWYPLVENYFFEDDFKDLFLICNVPLGQYLLTPHAGHIYLFRNLVFYAAARAFGTDPRGYFTVVWCIQLLNVGLLFVAVEAFTASAWIACFAAFVFGTCPVLDGSLGWFAVFGHVLATAALLTVLADAGRLVARRRPLGRARSWLWGAIMFASVTMFGVSIGMAMLCPFALALLLPPEIRNGRRLPLWPLLALVPVTYAGSLWLYSHAVAGTQLSDAGTVVSVSARAPLLLTGYALGLTAYGIDRLLSGPLPIEHFPAIPGVLVVAAAVVAGIWCLRDGRQSARLMLVAALLLTAGCYGSIAAGRLYFVFLGFARAVSPPRYQYAGVATLAFGLAAVIMALGMALPRAALWRAQLLAAVIAGWLVVVWVYPPTIDHHDQSRRDTFFAIAWMRSLAKQVPIGETAYIVNRHFRGVTPFMFTMRDFPGWAGLFSIFFPDPSIDGRRVVFIEPDPAVRAAFRDPHRLAAPEDVPALPEITPIDPVCPVPAVENALAQEH
jgi:hypothetical protein